MTEAQLRYALGISTVILPAPDGTVSPMDRALLGMVYLIEYVTLACRIFAISTEVRCVAIGREVRVLAVRC